MATLANPSPDAPQLLRLCCFSYQSISPKALFIRSFKSLFSISRPPSLCLAACRSWFRPSRSILSLDSMSRRRKSHLLSLAAPPLLLLSSLSAVMSRKPRPLAEEPGRAVVVCDLVMVEERDLERLLRSRVCSPGPRGTEGDGECVTRASELSLDEWAARARTSLAVRRVVFSTLSWR